MRRTLALVAAVALTVGCSASSDAVAGPGAAGDDTVDDTVDGEVVLTEMAIATEGTWPTGARTLLVRNAGGAHHNLIICPGDADGCAESGVAMDVVRPPEVRDPSVVPDRTSSLVLGAGADAVVRTDDLEPGPHLLWCAIPNHAARGMARVVEVG